MVVKIILWLIAAWLLIWLLGILLTLLPLIFIMLLTAIALLCIYSLLPAKFRINAFEQWLGVQRKPRTQRDSPSNTFAKSAP